MATIEHSDIEDPDIHEPKGADTATDQQIYVADGAGSGDWTDISGFVVLPIYPVGAVIDYVGLTAPNGWQFCYGQTLTRALYVDLFSAIGVNYGAGDGSTTFLVPDCRGRVSVGKDNMGGSSANRMATVIDGDVLGRAGGTEVATLSAAHIPALSGTAASAGNHTHTVTNGSDILSSINATSGSQYTLYGATSRTKEITTESSITVTANSNHTHTVTINSGSSTANHNNVQPTVIMNKIIFTGVFS